MVTALTMVIQFSSFRHAMLVTSAERLDAITPFIAMNCR